MFATHKEISSWYQYVLVSQQIKYRGILNTYMKDELMGNRRQQKEVRTNSAFTDNELYVVGSCLFIKKIHTEWENMPVKKCWNSVG